MHYYSTFTYQHLIAGEQQSQVWQQHVPALAASNTVLMRGVLALTALQYARNDPAQRDMYVARALHHHGASLGPFQEMVASATTATAEVIVVYGILLSMWVYASFEITSEQQSLDSILNMLEIVRSSRTVFHLYRDIILETPIGILLTPLTPESLRADDKNMAQDALRLLRGQIQHTADNQAVDYMQKLIEQYLTGTDLRRSAARWVASVDDAYWGRLRWNDPHALLVFAYSCLLSLASERECWWLAGWSERVLLACSDVLSPADKELVGWAGHVRLIRTWGDEFATVAKRREE